jgi:hypothetical protein
MDRAVRAEDVTSSVQRIALPLSACRDKVCLSLHSVVRLMPPPTEMGIVVRLVNRYDRVGGIDDGSFLPPFPDKPVVERCSSDEKRGHRFEEPRGKQQPVDCGRATQTTIAESTGTKHGRSFDRARNNLEFARLTDEQESFIASANNVGSLEKVIAEYNVTVCEAAKPAIRNPRSNTERVVEPRRPALIYLQSGLVKDVELVRRLGHP